jgi:hypothetical protein
VKQSGAPLSSRAPQPCENEENDARAETPTRYFSSGPLGTQFTRSPHLPKSFRLLAPISRIAYHLSPVLLIASPISRIHTRNPFQRHASYEPAPYLSQDRAFSPASVALPSPTPSELESV